MRKKAIVGVIMLLFMLAIAGCGGTPDSQRQSDPNAATTKDVILATTTSTADTGLLDILKPDFKEKTGYNIKEIAVGTGQALKMGENGDADVLLTHAPASEKPLVDAGTVINYQLVMHNDFVIVGPKDDPAGLKDAKDAVDALAKIAAQGSTFVSRADDSGTHKKELEIWKKAGVTPTGQDWYVESGTGMAQTLNVANEKNAYTLTDRGTYLKLKKNLELVVAHEGDPTLLNIYHVMQVNPEKFERVNSAGAKAFVEYMISSDTQKLIGDFGKAEFGESLFTPDAGKSGI